MLPDKKHYDQSQMYVQFSDTVRKVKLYSRGIGSFDTTMKLKNIDK